jgi:hypothetical protein
MEEGMIVKKVRLTVEQSVEGLRATIQRRDDPTIAGSAKSEAFLVESIEVAKRRASSVAKKHGLTSYAFIDKTRGKA